MPTWVRQAALDILRGTVSWGADQAAFASADAYCRFYRQHGEYKKDNEGKTELDYVLEITDRKPGAYIVGTRVVIVDEKLKPSFYY